MVRVGVIGCGWWSTRVHLPALAEHPEARIAAIADPAPDNLRAAAQAFGVRATFTGAEQLLRGAALDAVVVATPHATHHALARAALQRGIHVLVEKPMVLDPAHGRELVELARANGVQLVVNYPMNYNPQALAVRDELASGSIGPLEHVDVLSAGTARALFGGDPEAYRDHLGFPVNAPGAGTYSEPGSGGQGHTLLTHAAALLLWMSGLEPAAVAAVTERFELAVDLADAVAVRFAGGVVGSLGSVGNVPPGQEEVLRFGFFGRDGHIRFDLPRAEASVHGPGTAVRELPPPPPDLVHPDRAAIENLVGIALGRERNGSPAEVGLATVELIAAMHRSAAEGRLVAVR